MNSYTYENFLDFDKRVKIIARNVSRTKRDCCKQAQMTLAAQDYLDALHNLFLNDMSDVATIIYEAALIDNVDDEEIIMGCIDTRIRSFFEIYDKHFKSYNFGGTLNTLDNFDEIYRHFIEDRDNKLYQIKKQKQYDLRQNIEQKKNERKILIYSRNAMIAGMGGIVVGIWGSKINLIISGLYKSFTDTITSILQ